MLKMFSICLAALLCLVGRAEAHFGMVIPSSSIVPDRKAAELKLEISFSHPMEGQGMDMASPRAFSVTVNGKTEDLRGALRPATVMGHRAWTASHVLKRPGVHMFAMEPEPYFEPAEDSFIVHHTKTVVSAFGGEDGWDEPLGLKTEIVPLTRPFGNYAGNVFQGRVLLDGRAVPGAEVEVEFYNRDGRRAAPSEQHVTQVVKADGNGVFTWAVPWAGWWGFAALNTADGKMEHQGKPRAVELGAVLWLEFSEPMMKQ